MRIQEMLDAARKAQKFIGGRARRDLESDEQLSLALQRLVEILGEAAKHVTEETRALAGHIPWRKIAGMRDRLIHAYFDVDLDILWATVAEELPPLTAGLSSLLAGEPTPESSDASSE